MEQNRGTIAIHVIRHRETGLLIAFSEDLKGLYVHARTEEDLLERIPVAVRDILAADASRVID